MRENSLVFHWEDEAQGGMSRFLTYSPEQGYLLPRRVEQELGEKHLCFFIRRVVQRLS